MAKTTNLSSAIDMFGAICAEIASLEADKKKLRQTIIDAVGEGAAEGSLFRVPGITNAKPAVSRRCSVAKSC